MTAHGGFAATSSGCSSTSEAAAVPAVVPDDRRAAPSVTVIICVYTERRWTEIVRAVDSVRAQRVPADQLVVVVDHNPALFDRATAAFPEAVVVSSTGPRGLSGARNTGVAHARGDIVAFLDDDAAAEPDWLARLVSHYDDPRVLAVGGRAVPAWEGRRPRWLPPEFDWVVGCSFTGQPVRVAPVRNVIGCNMSFRRSVLDRIDGFDPALGRIGRTPVGCEETELCIRMRQRHPDGVVLYDPAARVRHRVTADRATWRYFRRRCFGEGRSKAVVARLVGAASGLSAERDYTRRALPAGVRRGLREIRAGDGAGLLRAAAIVAGLLLTASGYASALALRASDATATVPRPRRRAGPPPARVVTVELSEGVPDVPDGGPDGTRYDAAHVFVRLHGQPLGLLDIGLPPGGLGAPAHAAAIAQRLSKELAEHLRADGLRPVHRLDTGPLAPAAPCVFDSDRAGPAPFVSVIVPTCGNTRLLGRALDSLAGQDHPHYETVVVDNAPRIASTARLVAERRAHHPRLRYTAEPRAGVSHARNRGLAEARGEIVAFADDDVTVDRRWLSKLVAGFTDADVVAVTGQVLARELETPAQIWLEQYGGFGKGCRRRRFDRHGYDTVVAGTVERVPATRRSLYPYLPGAYGSGANMAFRTDALRRLGGFDPLLRTGEDIDVLLRVVLGGRALVYEPAAIVWHTHRREVRALRRSMYHYGVGLSAVVAKHLVTDRAGRRDLLGRLPRGIGYALRPGSDKNGGKRRDYPASLTALELCGMALGPLHYAAAAWSARAGGTGR
ncbi:Glycosyl transferase family 2 [Micromonospora pattaloongensis]|uniref:Glycosyl transferase family 2 n=1 Tax=Micromonospora pattaloongensis TaxID=405436 RepID=A0A1H3NVL2_9ACTN|nr:glycosyltransferase family 2 protein [Micromonospora pattaloongensis]SDY92693.1 Glycosyl transferase family 2 [Micromonospora pattaloongensis]